MELIDWEPLLVAAWRRLRGVRPAVADARNPVADAPKLVAGASKLVAGASKLVAAAPKLVADPVDEALSAAERRDVLAGAARLSRGLTRERELAGARYFDDPQLLGAYLLLYWPVSYAQARAVLPEVGAPLGRVLDVGSGPAPLALAALDAGAESLLAIDRSEAALTVGRALAAARPSREAGAAGKEVALATERWEPGQALPQGAFDTILLGHVLNELFGQDIDRRMKLVQSLLSRLHPSGCVVILEPALRETSRELLTLRDRLVAAGATVRAPCLFRGACPALLRESDWCHAERTFAPPPLVTELADAAQLHRDRLKMSYLILQAPGAPWPEPPPGRLFRIVSEPLDRKGQHRFVGCGPEGRAPLVLPEKHVRDGNRAFVELERGDVIAVEELEPRGDGLRLSDRSTVKRIAAAGRPVPRGSGD
jgi:SAM-dependent methyltransferase